MHNFKISAYLNVAGFWMLGYPVVTVLSLSMLYYFYELFCFSLFASLLIEIKGNTISALSFPRDLKTNTYMGSEIRPSYLKS